MRRLPPAVRSALTYESSPTAQSSARRWSLRSLAELNGPVLSPPGAVGGGETAVIPSSDAAESLLRDVRIRLAGQRLRAEEMLEEGRIVSGGGLPKAAMGAGGGVIKAVNHPVGTSLVQWSRDLEMADDLAADAVRQLEGLVDVHADTYHLAHQLLPPPEPSGDGDPRPRPEYLSRWSAADQSLVASAFEQIRSRHASSVETLADAVLGLRRCRSLRNGEGRVLSPAYFCGVNLDLIDDFLRRRLGVQLLCDHYVKLDKGRPTGGISVDCDLWEVVDDAVTEARHVCDANLGIAPEVCAEAGLEGCPPFGGLELLRSSHVGGGDGRDVTVTLIRPWLHHVLVEVLKNAMASNVKRALSDAGGDVTDPTLIHPDDVHVRILDADRHVSVLVVDRGYGIDADSSRRAFRFADSSSPKRWCRMEEQQSYAAVRAPLGSLGVGLPLSRLMARMFGGDVVLANRFGGVNDGGGEPGGGGGRTVGVRCGGAAAQGRYGGGVGGPALGCAG